MNTGIRKVDGTVWLITADYQAGLNSVEGFTRPFGDIRAEIATELGATEYAPEVGKGDEEGYLTNEIVAGAVLTDQADAYAERCSRQPV